MQCLCSALFKICAAFSQELWQLGPLLVVLLLVNGGLEMSRSGNTTSNIGPESFSREKTGSQRF